MYCSLSRKDCSLSMCYFLYHRLHMTPIIYKSASWWWRTSINMPGCRVDSPPLVMLWLANMRISMLSVYLIFFSILGIEHFLYNFLEFTINDNFVLHCSCCRLITLTWEALKIHEFWWKNNQHHVYWPLKKADY